MKTGKILSKKGNNSIYGKEIDDQEGKFALSLLKLPPRPQEFVGLLRHQANTELLVYPEQRIPCLFRLPSVLRKEVSQELFGEHDRLLQGFPVAVFFQEPNGSSR